MLIVEPRPRRNWHRYSSEQMSGPLPPIMYKYLPSRYAETMVGRGEVMFSTLAWFQNYEDDQRGDRFEALREHLISGDYLRARLVHSQGLAARSPSQVGLGSQQDQQAGPLD